MIILYKELDTWTSESIKERIWLKKPVDPKTGKASYKLFLWLIPAFIVYFIFEETPIEAYIGNLILIPFPFIASLPQLELETLSSPEFI